jgi:hypothetical protein
MTLFERLPRELRDLIYGYVANEQSVYIASGTLAPKLMTGWSSMGLLLANRQTYREYHGVLLRTSSVVLCFDKSNLDEQTIAVHPIISMRTRHLTAIIDLDGLKEKGWKPKGPSTAMSPMLLDLIAQVEHGLRSFSNLESVDLQWWNDLSTTSDRNNLGQWMNALVSCGLIRTQELWYGYLGGKLSNPKQVRDHVISMHNSGKRMQSRASTKEGLQLLPEDNGQLASTAKVAVTPMSFF